MAETPNIKIQEKPETSSYLEHDNHHHHGAVDDDDHDDDNEINSYAYAIQIVQQATFPMVTKTAMELDLFGIMGRAGPGCQLSAAEIASFLPAAIRNPEAPAMLERILFHLATYSVVTCTTITTVEGGRMERRYGLGGVAKYFVPDEDGISLAPLLDLNLHKAHLLSWNKLKDAILGGGSAFNLANGMEAFEYSQIDPRYNDAFNKAMYHHSAYITKRVLRCYDGFDNIETLVDVGGGLGHTLDAITSQYPSIRGINFDLAHVIQQAPLIRAYLDDDHDWDIW